MAETRRGRRRDDAPVPGRRIEDYALLGDLRTAALVGRDGSIDWLCLPQLDSPACFASLLGSDEHGRWLIAPTDAVVATRRRYRGPSLVLETEFETAGGRATVIDFMPPVAIGGAGEVVRIIVGQAGSVEMETELALRFDYGRTVPWVRRVEGGITAVAGAAGARLLTPVALEGREMRTVGRFTVREGERIPFRLAWYCPYLEEPPRRDAEQRLADTEGWWREWSSGCVADLPERDAVLRSLVTLKGLTHAPSGGIAAAATTSLPERLGGERNWDYRFCWLRDATFTLYALLLGGLRAEATHWVRWLVRAAAGAPSQLQVMYSVRGERLLGETELPWLPGFGGSRPVRVGNAAHSQVQLDVYGELFDTLHGARKNGIELPAEAWAIQRALVGEVERAWRDPDHGLWEMRARPRHFTHSKLMAWVAVDRAVAAVERFGLEGPAERWRALRREIAEAVCAEGFNPRRNAFVQEFGGDELDAALLMLPLVGFLPPDDPRVRGTVDAIRRELTVDGLVRRYRTERGVDGLPGDEGVFLLTSFWLADCLVLDGRREEGEELFHRLLGLRNDVGLLAEEYDPRARRQLGNFPQAFSHVGLIATAHNLRLEGPAQKRGEQAGAPRAGDVA